MPRYWGAWTDVAGGGNQQRFRLGMDYTVSGTRVTVDNYVFQAAYAIHKSITLTRTGRLSGSYSVSVSTSGGIVTLGRGGSVTGSRGGSVTIGGRATNVLHGLVPSFSLSVSIPAVAPSAPGRPTISNITSSGSRAAWSAPSSNGGAAIQNYHIQISTDSSFGSTNVNNSSLTARNHTNTGRLANTTYHVRVRARNSAGWSGWSASRAFTTLPQSPSAPSAPSLVANNPDTSTTLSWSRNQSSAAPYASQRVQRRVFSEANNGWGAWGNRATVSGTATSWTDTSTRNNRCYQWRIVAVNAAGTGASGASVSRWTTPWVPGSVEAQSAAAGIVVRYRVNVQYGSHDHEIQHSAGGGAWSQIAVLPGEWAHHWTTREWTHTDPDLSVTHRYRIRSRTASGPLYASDWVESNLVQLAAPPSAPSNLGPSGPWDASEDRALTWTHVPTDGSDQERFQVRHRPQGAGSWTTVAAVASSVESWTLPGGTYSPGDVVEWQVRTRGVHPDWSPYSPSNFQSPTTRPTVAINEPFDGAVVETSSATVSWGYAGPGDDGDGGVSGQAAWRLVLLRDGRSVTEESGSGDRDTFGLSGLSDGSAHTVRVEVRSGEGLWSHPDEVGFEVSYLPPAPPQVGVTWDRDRGAAVVDVTNAEPHEPEVVAHSLVANPRGRDTDGTVVVVEDYEGSESPDPDLELVDGDLVGPAPVGWSAQGDGVVYYSQRFDMIACRLRDGGAGAAATEDVPPEGTATAVVDMRGEPGWEVFALGGWAPSTVQTMDSDRQTIRDTRESLEWLAGFGISDADPGATIYGRVLAVEGAYDGPYFDGDTPRGEGQDGSLVTYTWEADGTSTATATSIEVSHNQLWRAIDDGPWLLLEDDLDLNGAISDPLPAIGDRRRNLYRVTAISTIGSAMHSEEYELIVPTHGPEGNHGYVYLNGGPSMGDVVKVRANATRSGTQGLAKAQRYYSGNGRPEERSGTALAREWTLDVHSREDLYEAGESRPEDTEALQVTGGVICYRDTKGARWFASMGPVGDSYRSILGDLSWPMVEVGYREGLASEAREAGDDDQ